MKISDKQRVLKYLKSVDRSFLEVLKGGTIENMVHTFVKPELKDIVKGTRIVFWKEKNVENIVLLGVQCYLYGLKQVPFASVSPDFIVDLPELELRFDWFIKTGSESLDSIFTDIALKNTKFLGDEINDDTH